MRARTKKKVKRMNNYTILLTCSECGCQSPVLASIPDDTPQNQPICASALCFHCDSDISTTFASFKRFKADSRVTVRVLVTQARKGRGK